MRSYHPAGFSGVSRSFQCKSENSYIIWLDGSHLWVGTIPAFAAVIQKGRDYLKTAQKSS